MDVKMAKIRLPKKCNNFGIDKDSNIKILYNYSKASKYIM